MLDDYLRQYGVLIIFALISIAVPVGMLSISALGSRFRIRPSRPSIVKSTAYEGGMKPFSPRPSRFNLRYYYFALLFVLFDIEAALLFPVAVKFGVASSQFGWTIFGALMLFLFILTVGYLYAWRKNALDWR